MKKFSLFCCFLIVMVELQPVMNVTVIPIALLCYALKNPIRNLGERDGKDSVPLSVGANAYIARKCALQSNAANVEDCNNCWKVETPNSANCMAVSGLCVFIAGNTVCRYFG